MENRLSADSIAVCGNFDIMGECGGWCSTEKGGAGYKRGCFG